MTAPSAFFVVAAATAALVAFGAVGLSIQWRLPPGDPRRARSAQPTARHRACSGRRDRHVDARHLPAGVEVLEHAARDLRAGRSLSTALAEALDPHPLVLVDVRDGLRRGAGAHAAIDAAVRAGRAATADERLLLQAVSICRDAGRSAPDVLERAADVLRERQAWRRERHSQAAQARLSARVLTGLPVVFALWSALTDEGVRAAYRTSPLPTVCAAVGGVLNVVGWWWMQRLTGRSR